MNLNAVLINFLSRIETLEREVARLKRKARKPKKQR